MRLDDVMGEKENLYETLKKQARQAVRYRKLSDTIRRLEAMMMLTEWHALTTEAQATKERLVQTNEKLNTSKQHLFDLQKTRDTLQENQKQARASLEETLNKKRALELQKDKAQDKLEQLDEKRRSIEEQQEQAIHDLKHEQSTLIQATEKLTALELEKEELEKTVSGFDDDFTTTLNTRDETKQKFDDANNTLSQRKSAYAAQQTQRQYLETRQTSLLVNQENVSAQLKQLQTTLVSEQQKSTDNNNEASLRNAVTGFEKEIEKTQHDLTEKARHSQRVF